MLKKKWVVQQGSVIVTSPFKVVLSKWGQHSVIMLKNSSGHLILHEIL